MHNEEQDEDGLREGAIERGIYAASCTLHCKTKHFSSGQFDNRFPSNAQAVTLARVVEQKSERNEKYCTEYNISKEKEMS